jgi:hypothetical protein
MHRKAFALDFLKLASTGHVQEAYTKYVHPDFVHHNPYFAGDRASLMKGMEENHAQFPEPEAHNNCRAATNKFSAWFI